MEDQRRVATDEPADPHVRAAVEAGGLGTWEWDLARQKLTWGGALELMHGLAPGSACDAESFLGAMLPRDRKALERRGRRIMEKGGRLNREYRVAGADGAVRWIEARGRAVCDARGHATRIAGICLDITRRKLQQERLERSRDYLAHAQQFAAFGSWEWDMTSDRISQSEALGDIYGRGGGNTMSSLAELFAVMHPQDRAGVREVLDRVRRDGKPYVIQFRAIRPDGSVRVIQGHGAVIVHENDKPVRVLGITQDLTDRQAVLAALQESEQRFRQITETIREVFWMTNVPKTEMIYVSPAYEEIWGRSCQSLYESPASWLDAIHPDDRPRVADSAALRQPTGNYQEIYRITRPDGSVRWILDRAFPVRDSSGRIYRVTGLAEDITDRKRAEEAIIAHEGQLRSLASELSQAEERERRRLAMLLHDQVGQSLALVQMKLELLRNGTRGSKGTVVEDLLQIMEQVIGHTRSLTCELSPPVLYELGFVAAVEWLVEQAQNQTGLPIAFQDDGKPKPLADDVRILLFQSVRELLANIAKHARARSGRVEIRRNRGHVEILVEDDGVGFDTAAATARPDADCFGLFSIRERLRYHGGRLDVESAPGRGSRFTLSIHLRSNHAAPDKR